MEFYVDCDGTTGWINVDTFTGNNNNSMTYYMNGNSIQDIAVSSGNRETSFTFLI
jgi:SH3-like domain-containing protein